MSKQPSFFLHLSVSASECHSVNINHNSFCCQSRGLQLRLYILGNVRWPTASALSSISIPSAFHSHSISSKTNFCKCGFGSNEEKFHWAWADGIHRQTWEANATVASEMRRNNVLMVLRVRARHELESLNASDALSLVTSDLQIRHNPPSNRPTISSVLTLAFGFRRRTSEGKISRRCKEKTWRLRMLSFHLVEKKETPAFPDNGSHSITPLCALWIIHTETGWLRLSVHTHTHSQENLNGIPQMHYISQDASRLQ